MFAVSDPAEIQKEGSTGTVQTEVKKCLGRGALDGEDKAMDAKRSMGVNSTKHAPWVKGKNL